MYIAQTACIVLCKEGALVHMRNIIIENGKSIKGSMGRKRRFEILTKNVSADTQYYFKMETSTRSFLSLSNLNFSNPVPFGLK